MSLRRAVCATIITTLLLAPAMALAQQKVLKYAHFQPARPDQPKHAAALAFKEHVEKATNGSIKVEIFPAGQFGNDADTMSGLRLGTLEMAVAHDGAIAGIYKPIGILGIPFLYDNHEHAWRVYDSPWLKEFSDDMVKKTGVRLLSLADNGVRHFTNSKRTIRTPDDMKGLKIRVMPSPVFQTLVTALGASPSAIPWAELPTALQQKVVDGEENGVTNIIAASLYQYQKYITLDGHVWSIHGYTINEKFYQGLSAVERKAVEEGTQIATGIHRKMTSDQDKNAKEILTKLGMEVTEITPAELGQFRRLAQPPVKAWAEKEIGKEYVDSLFKAIETTRR
jgi:TRAP-type transport system periplasmic protein